MHSRVTLYVGQLTISLAIQPSSVTLEHLNIYQPEGAGLTNTSGGFWDLASVMLESWWQRRTSWGLEKGCNLCICYKVIQCGYVDAHSTPVLWHVSTHVHSLNSLRQACFMSDHQAFITSLMTAGGSLHLTCACAGARPANHASGGWILIRSMNAS